MSYKPILFALPAITCMACAILLVGEYRARRTRLMLWSALCFAGLSINNVLLFVDLIVLPNVDLRLFRLAAALGGMLFLIYGFIWEVER